MTGLFTPFALKNVTLRNRIGIAPMCQYMADDGIVGDWHLAHLGARAIGGAGLVIAEGTAVSPEGRITRRCAGMWDDRHVAPWARIAAFVKMQGAVPGIQLAHAGRMAASRPPWVEKGTQLPADDPTSWQPIAASPVPFGGNALRMPLEMTAHDIARVRQDFASAAKRACAAGFEWLELHFGHGYLAQNFFSPLSNHRTDDYGGDFAGRARFLLECVESVRAVWPERLPLTVKLGVTDFVPEGHSLAEATQLVRLMAARGVDLIDVSLGFNLPDVSAIPWGPAFMVPIAREIREATSVPVAVGWMIDAPEQADQILRDGNADLILLGRASLADPNWPFHAAHRLNEPAPWALLPIQMGDWLKPRIG